VLAIAGAGAWWLTTLDDDAAPASSATQAAGDGASSADSSQFAALRSYVDEHTAALEQHTKELDAAADDYLALVESVNGDYAKLATAKATETQEVLGRAREAWQLANPSYEEMEGVIAGTPSLAKYDVSIDAGAPVKEDPENAVDFDVKVDADRTLGQPGNYFLLSEATLYGTEPEWSTEQSFDVDADGKASFGDLLPDAKVLKAVSRDFAAEAAKLRADATAWTPNQDDAYTALVVMTPTMGEYFESWKASRFVAGDKATERGFAASSRLDDVVGILTGLGVIRESVADSMAKADPAAAKATKEQLAALTTFVDDLRKQEHGGTHFTAQDADRYGADAQEQAEQIAASITDMGRELGVKIDA
jgi:hypothetical protein